MLSQYTERITYLKQQVSNLQGIIALIRDESLAENGDWERVLDLCDTAIAGSEVNDE